MANDKKGPDLGQQLQELISTANQRQADLADQIGGIRCELEDLLALGLPIELSDDVREEVQKLAASVGAKPEPEKPKPKEDYRGKNISTEQKVAFVQETLQEGPLSKKEMLDRAEAQYDRSVAPTFLDTAIDECLEGGLIEDTGEKKGRSTIYLAK